MAILNTQGISLYYELIGDPSNPPVLLISGLGGMAASWSSQIQRFAESYYVILPDQRGTGQTTRAKDGYSTYQLAADMASLIDHLGLGPVHVVGSSTGGAIAQYMALDFAGSVRSLILSSSFARFDPFMKRQFEVRRKMSEEWDRPAMFSGYALFLFSPQFTREYPEKVTAWINRAASYPATSTDQMIGLMRLEMVEAHDTVERLKEISKPTLVLSGDHNICTLPQNSEELAQKIAGAELVLFKDGGELIEIEQEEKFFQVACDFIDRIERF